jgi:hypothetical protein
MMLREISCRLLHLPLLTIAVAAATATTTTATAVATAGRVSTVLAYTYRTYIMMMTYDNCNSLKQTQ